MLRRKSLPLEEQHTKDVIKARLVSARQHSYLGDSLLGAIDGTVTTFAVISSVAGAGFRGEIAVVLGLANLLADGFSMAVGNYLRAKADEEVIQKARQTEEYHIQAIPAGEREEIKQIFAAKGFSEPTLSEIMRVISQNKELWINTMLTEELGLRVQAPDPIKAAISTFIAFSCIGAIPLSPFLVFTLQTSEQAFIISAMITALSFFVVGMLKGSILDLNPFSTGLQTLLMGAGASLLAFYTGSLSKEFLASP